MLYTTAGSKRDTNRCIHSMTLDISGCLKIFEICHRICGTDTGSLRIRTWAHWWRPSSIVIRSPAPDDGTNWITVSQCMIQSFQKHGIDILPFAVSASLSTAGEKVSTGRTILD